MTDFIAAGAGPPTAWVSSSNRPRRCSESSCPAACAKRKAPANPTLTGAFCTVRQLVAAQSASVLGRGYPPSQAGQVLIYAAGATTDAPDAAGLFGLSAIDEL